MLSTTTIVTADDGKPLAVRAWTPDGLPIPAPLAPHGPAPARAGSQGAPRAILQVLHGMAEHSARYEGLARAAVERGLAVIADDRRGHGATIAEPSERGHTADRDGWNTVLSDVARVRAAARASWPGVPVVLLGHSWGSLIARGDAARRGDELAALAVLGTPGDPGLLGRGGIPLATAVAAVRGPRYRSRFLESQGIGPYSKPFRPNRTDVDWVSSDEDEVDAYIADPLCGFTCTSGFYRDLAIAGVEVNTPRSFRALPDGLPVLVMSGAQDPVSGMGAGAREVAAGMTRGGQRDVAVRVVPGARHDLLHEECREAVIAEILDWADSRL